MKPEPIPRKESRWRADSDMIFTQISTGNFDDYAMAERAICLLYVPDLTITRAGIAHAAKRLEKFYEDQRQASS